MRITDCGDDKAVLAGVIELELSVEELEQILAPTPSIPIPPPLG
jgi:hypothetical protein